MSHCPSRVAPAPSAASTGSPTSSTAARGLYSPVPSGDRWTSCGWARTLWPWWSTKGIVFGRAFAVRSRDSSSVSTTWPNIPRNRPSFLSGESWRTAALAQGVEPDGVAPGARRGPLSGHHPPMEVRILRPVFADCDPFPPIPHSPRAVGAEEADSSHLGGRRQRAEHEAVRTRLILEVEPSVGNEGGNPSCLLPDRLEAAAELAFQEVEHGVRAFVDEAPGALRRAPQPEPEHRPGGERDERPEPEYGYRRDRNAPAPRGSVDGADSATVIRPGARPGSGPGSRRARREPVRTGGGRGSSP